MSAQNEMQEQVLGGRVSHFEPSNNRKCFKCEWSDSLKELGLPIGHHCFLCCQKGSHLKWCRPVGIKN